MSWRTALQQAMMISKTNLHDMGRCLSAGQLHREGLLRRGRGLRQRKLLVLEFLDNLCR